MVRASACACCLHRGLPPHGLKRNPPVPVQAMYSTPPKLSHFGSFFVLRKRPEFGTKRPAPAASTGWRSGHSGTLQGANSGTQTHSRRTGSKLGRLHRARQGLVRVPESNTKYGGKRGKTGGPRRRCYAQVSVSPQGFPSEKNRLWGAASPFVPLFTGQLFIVAEGLPRTDSREATGDAPDMSGQTCRAAHGLLPR